MGRRRPSDLVREAAERHGTRGPNSRGNYSVCCPFCPDRAGKPDDAYKLSVHPRGVFHCYRCGAGGGGDFSWLGAVEAAEPPPAPRDYLEPPPGFLPLDDGARSLDPFRDYLRRRGVLDAASHVGAGACLAGRYGGRVVVPMRDESDGWVGFSARAVGQREPKYLYPPGMDRRASLWGLEWVMRLRDKTSPVYLVEGVFDALPLFPHGLAAFGKEVTDQQLSMLAALRRPVVVCLDGDAWEEGRAVAQRLRMRGAEEVSWARLPPTTDPGSLGWEVKNYARLLE